MKTVVFTFGRMNPMTTGHAKLVDKVRSVARLEGGDPLVFLSHTNDKKKNPLLYMDKVRFAQSAFGKIVQRSNSNTIIKVLKELERGYDRVVLVVGSDRVDDMRTLLEKYNGKDYTFQDIQVVSAGERDPDADDVSGMSASKMRQFVVDNDIDSFTTGLPGPLQRKAQEVFDAIRKGMGIKEDVSETFFLKLNEDAIQEALKPKETSFGTDVGASNGQFLSVNFPSHGSTLATVFKESEKPYLVFLDSQGEVGFMAYVSEKEYTGLNKLTYDSWSDTSDPSGRRKRAFGGVWRVFNKVFFVILKLINQKNPPLIKFNGATPDLQKVYDRMSENEPFLKSLSDVGFKYDGKKGDYHHFVKSMEEDVDLEESILKKIAALALALGLASAGDGAYAKDHDIKKWNQTYNSLTIKQKKQVDDMIQFESQKNREKTL